MDSPPELEHLHGHAHGSGRRWVDLIVSVSAIAISAISLLLAVQHGHAMERMVEENRHMVEANTWPYLIVGMANSDANGNRLFRLILLNNGVGPAKVERIEYTYHGRHFADSHTLARAIRESEGVFDGKLATADTGGVLPARQSVDLLGAQAPLTPPRLVDALLAHEPEIDVDVCYCSIFDECWTVSKQRNDSRPQPVAQCRAPAAPAPAQASRR